MTISGDAVTCRSEKPTSGHSEYDRSEESKGYDRGQQTQARLKFHRSLLATSVLRNPSRALVPLRRSNPPGEEVSLGGQTKPVGDRVTLPSARRNRRRAFYGSASSVAGAQERTTCT